MSITLLERAHRCAIAAVIVLGWVPVPAKAQIVVKNEDVSIKFGVLGQLWGDWTQDSTSGMQGYQQNLYIRRGRLIMGGDIGKDSVSLVLLFRQAPRCAHRPVVCPTRHPTPLAQHWGDFGWTPHGKDGEIRVRTGKFTKQAWPGHTTASGVLSIVCVEDKGVKLAPQTEFEPATNRLTAIVLSL